MAEKHKKTLKAERFCVISHNISGITLNYLLKTQHFIY